MWNMIIAMRVQTKSFQNENIAFSKKVCYTHLKLNIKDEDEE